MLPHHHYLRLLCSEKELTAGTGFCSVGFSAAMRMEAKNYINAQMFVMETSTTQQEVLLFTGTTFSQRELSNVNDQDNSRLFRTAKEQWKEGSWNGMLADLLPEIFEKPGIARKLFLWNVYEGKFFVGLEMAEQLVQPDAAYSINPQLIQEYFNEN